MTSRKYESWDFEECLSRFIYDKGVVLGYQQEDWLVDTTARQNSEEGDIREIHIVFNASCVNKAAFDKIRQKIRMYKPKLQTDLEMSEVILPALERMMRYQIRETILKEDEGFAVYSLV